MLLEKKILVNNILVANTLVSFSAQPQVINSSVAWWYHYGNIDVVNIDSGDGLVPDGTKPSPESMFIFYPWDFMALIYGLFHRKWWRYQFVK